MAGQVQAGTKSQLPSYFPDWFPTLCAVAGADVPTNQRLDGIDLSPELKGDSTPDRIEPMIWDFHGYGGIVAICDGKWKAIRRDLLRKEPANWELYDLEKDRDETTDLAEKHPDIVARLEASYINHRVPEPDFPLPIYDR